MQPRLLTPRSWLPCCHFLPSNLATRQALAIPSAGRPNKRYKKQGHKSQLASAPCRMKFFTSGATESNNWVVRGLLETARQPLHFITSPTEHSSILSAFKWLEGQSNVEVSWAPVNKYGQVSVDDVAKLIRPTTRLMSFMWVNNETGSLNPILQLTKLAKENKIYLHSDATQAVGKIPVHVENSPVDLLSLSGHKIYGPKGVGALFIRSRNPKVQISPLLLGGGQERGLRAGTLNVPGIVGLGEACSIAAAVQQQESMRQAGLRDLLQQNLVESFPGLQINGHPDERSPNTLNVTFKGYVVPAQIAAIAISRGSACNSESMRASPVLQALGLSETDAQNTLRLSLGRSTSKEDILATIGILRQVIQAKNSQA